MRVLDCGQYDHIVSWTVDGLSIVMHKPMCLVEREDGSLLPHVVSEHKNGNEEKNNGAGTKFKSFLRRVS